MAHAAANAVRRNFFFFMASVKRIILSSHQTYGHVEPEKPIQEDGQGEEPPIVWRNKVIICQSKGYSYGTDNKKGAHKEPEVCRDSGLRIIVHVCKYPFFRGKRQGERGKCGRLAQYLYF
jgi:hypothetical protein